MKQILFTNWNFRRILFLGAGIFISIQSIQQKEWMGVIFGSYFTLMGIFQLGCASGNCAIRMEKVTSSNEAEEITFEEIK